MNPAQQPKRELLRYLIPVAIGLGGILYSQTQSNLVVRVVVLCASLAVPLFAGGVLLARYKTGRIERAVLFAAVFLLVLGAGVSISGLSNPELPESFLRSGTESHLRILGLFSLLLGLFVVLFTVARTGEDIEEIGAYFHHLAGHMMEGFIFTRADGVILMVNDRLLTMMDLRRQDLVGRNSLDVARSLNLPAVEAQIGNRNRGLASEYEIAFYVRGEKRRLWFSGTPIHDRQGRFVAILTTVRDITEHVNLKLRAERYAERLQELVEAQSKKLIQSEERYRKLLTTMNEGFAAVDLDKKIRFANERLSELLGVPARELAGRDIFDFVDVISRVHLFTLLSERETEGGGARCELNFLDHEGELVPTLVASAYMRDLDNETPLHSLVITSLAEQKDLQRELEVRAMALEQVNEELRMHGRAKDGFLSNVSHELRTPLSTVQGYAEMLESGALGPLDAAQAGAVKVMRRNLARLIDLITEMIEFSRMEIWGITLNPALFSPGRLLREAAAAIHPLALAKDISVNVFLEDDLPHVWGDYAKLNQTLGVLCSNAVKFTGAGGNIRLSAQRRPGHGLALTVADTGIGIDPAYRERIFAKFFQVDSSKTRQYQGAGIGLSIAKTIMEAHRGDIELDSELGKGSAFTVVLPGMLFECDESGLSSVSFQDLRALMVDESGEMNEPVCGLLSRVGCQVRPTASIYECLRQAEAEEPDLVILNDTRPDTEEMAALDLLRQHPATNHTPVVIMVAGRSSRMREAGNLWHDVLVMEKPFTVERLLSAVRSLCFGEAPEAAPWDVPEADPGGPPRPRVLVIDSDPGMLEWMEMALLQRHVPFQCVPSAHQAAATAEEHPPDVVLVDADISADHFTDRLGIIMKSEPLRKARIYLMSGGVLPDSSENIAGILRKPFSIHEVDGLIYAGAPLAARRADHP